MIIYRTETAIKGLVVVAKPDKMNIREGPSTDSTVLATIKKGSVAGVLTGRYVNQSDGYWFEFINSKPWKGKKRGFARYDVILKWSREKSNQLVNKGVNLVKNLVNSDIEIFHSLARSGAILNDLTGKGIQVSKKQKVYQDLLNRLSGRQEKIKQSKLVKWQTGLRKGYQKILEGFKKYIYATTGVKVGAVPVVAVIVGVVIGAGLAITAYFVFKSDYTESTEDLKVSADLEKALASVDPETAAKIKQDLEGQVDTAYAKGKTTGKFTGILGTVKYLVLAAAGFFIVNWFIDKQHKRA